MSIQSPSVNKTKITTPMCSLFTLFNVRNCLTDNNTFSKSNNYTIIILKCTPINNDNNYTTSYIRFNSRTPHHSLVTPFEIFLPVYLSIDNYNHTIDFTQIHNCFFVQCLLQYFVSQTINYVILPLLVQIRLLYMLYITANSIAPTVS